MTRRDDANEGTVELARVVHRAIVATAEQPLDERTNRWLGEAEAIAADVATGDLDEETARTRMRQVRHMLEEAGETGHDGADDHLETARRGCREILEGQNGEP